VLPQEAPGAPGGEPQEVPPKWRSPKRSAERERPDLPAIGLRLRFGGGLGDLLSSVAKALRGGSGAGWPEFGR
jgi:hypothetical protein